MNKKLPNWVKTSERKPELTERVLCFWKGRFNNCVEMGYREQDCYNDKQIRWFMTGENPRIVCIEPDFWLDNLTLPKVD